MRIRKAITGALAIALSIAVFSQMFYVSMKLTRDNAVRERMKTEEADTASSVVVSCKAAPALAPQEASEEVGVSWFEPPVVYTGWDGRTMAEWEMDLFARVFYLEFWQPDITLCEAGCDAFLNLWTSGIYGDTMYECLSYYDPQYGYTYRVYPRVWETIYDADGLEWCRQFCLERFYNGPEWVDAMYFQLGGYHDPSWSIPLYEISGVYFSARK